MNKTDLNTITDDKLNNADVDNENPDIIKIPSVKTSITDLRVSFQTELAKLNNNNTKAQAFTQMKQLISTNATQEALRIFINSLTSYYSSCTFQAKELIVIAYGYLANIYRDSLLDTLDKPPSITKTLNRLLSHIRSVCLKDNSYTIHKACSLTVIDLLELCMPKNQLEAIFTLFFEPFVLLASSSVNLHVKEGAGVYLNDLVYHLGKKRDDFSLTMLTNIYPSLIELICKSSEDLQYHYECLLNLLQALPFDYFKERLKDILCSMVNVLKHEKYSYQTRVNCLNVLKVIGKRIFLYKLPLEGKDQLMESMRNYLKDRNHKVQVAAQEAIKNWNAIQKDYFIEDLANEPRIKRKKEKTALAMIKRAGQGTEHFDSELPEEMREVVYNKGIGDVLKLSSVMKNHSRLNRNKVPQSTSNAIQRHLNHPSIRKYDEVNQMPFSSQAYPYEDKFQFIEDTVRGTENAWYVPDTEVMPLTPRKQKANAFSLDKVLSLIDFNGIKQSAQGVKESFSAFEKKMSKRVYQIEEKVNAMRDLIDHNASSMIKYHNNILDETECDIKDNTELDIPIYDAMPLDDNLNDIKPRASSSFIEDTHLLVIWKKALSEINAGQIENAFNRIFSLGDDIYLLRLMLMNKGKMINMLSPNLSNKLLLRINKINHSHQIESLFFSFISQVISNKDLQLNLTQQDANELLHSLSEYSLYNNQAISSKASSLYNSILYLFQS